MATSMAWHGIGERKAKRKAAYDNRRRSGNVADMMRARVMTR